MRRLKEQRRATVEALRTESRDNPMALVLVSKGLERYDSDAAAAKALAYQTYRLGRVSYGASYRQHDGGARQAGADAGRTVNLGGARGSLSGRQLRLGSC